MLTGSSSSSAVSGTTISFHFPFSDVPHPPYSSTHFSFSVESGAAQSPPHSAKDAPEDSARRLGRRARSSEDVTTMQGTAMLSRRTPPSESGLLLSHAVVVVVAAAAAAAAALVLSRLVLSLLVLSARSPAPLVPKRLIEAASCSSCCSVSSGSAETGRSERRCARDDSTVSPSSWGGVS